MSTNFENRLVRWTKFLVGISLLALAVWFFASGYSPPGSFGKVLRHNQQNKIDASPLFYSEVEHMSELEAEARRMMKGK